MSVRMPQTPPTINRWREYRARLCDIGPYGGVRDYNDARLDLDLGFGVSQEKVFRLADVPDPPERVQEQVRTEVQRWFLSTLLDAEEIERQRFAEQESEFRDPWPVIARVLVPAYGGDTLAQIWPAYGPPISLASHIREYLKDTFDIVYSES